MCLTNFFFSFSQKYLFPKKNVAVELFRILWLQCMYGSCYKYFFIPRHSYIYLFKYVNLRAHTNTHTQKENNKSVSITQKNIKKQKKHLMFLYHGDVLCYYQFSLFHPLQCFKLFLIFINMTYLIYLLEKQDYTVRKKINDVVSEFAVGM